MKSDLSMEPLKITVCAANMSIPALPIHLDDVLAYAIVNEYRNNHAHQDNIDYESLISALPLGSVGNEDWIWQASIFEWTHMQGKFMRPISSRLNQNRFAIDRSEGVLNVRMNNLNLASGPLKSSIGLLPMSAESVGTAYCIGDKAAIKRLLNEIQYLGKKHNRGHGRVKEWRVTSSSQDEAQKWTNRSIPLSLKQYKNKAHILAHNIGVRPPYWDQPHAMAYTVV